MRWRVPLTVILAWILTVPFSLSHAEQTLQQRYLDIYLKINDAEHLEKQGDFRGALDDFKDCYAKLAKIHDTDPNWESALVVHRMEDCKAKILDLTDKAAGQPETPPPPTPTPPTPAPDNTSPPPPTGAASDEVTSLKLQLEEVKEELRTTKDSLKDSQAMVETYRTQLETVNQQLAAVNNQQSVDERMGKLLSDNKSLTDRLASAEKELDVFKSNPKSKLALVEVQLKNLQDQYDASQEANKALQDTTTTLKQQLDQAQADLVAANQKLAAAPTGSPEYETLKRENEIMRDILTRELQEQAHRDMAKRLAQEEFDNLKLKSKVLQEQLDILGSPMTPPTNDQERELLASLKVPGPDVTEPSGNGFSAPSAGSAPSAPDASTNTATATPPTPSAPDTNVASATPPATNSTSATDPTTNAVPPASTTDTTTNQPPSTVVSSNQAPAAPDTSLAPVSGTNMAPASSNPPTTGADTNSVAAVNPPPTAPSSSDSTAPPPPAATNTADTMPATTTNAPDTSAPISPSGATPPTNTSTPPPAVPAANTNAPTTTQLPPAQTTYTDTTIKNNSDDPAKQADPTQYSTKARLPDDMRDTAQDAADLFKNQRYDEAAAKYQSIIDKYPESLYAWSNLGVVRFQQGKFEEALKALQQAVKLSPTDAFSYSNLGIVYYQLNQFENAIDALNSAKALDPNDAKTHNYLGCACSQKGWQEVAEKEFRKAIEIDPNFGDAHFNLALVYATSKPPLLELARREYNRALELGIAKDPRLEKLLQPQ